MLNKNRVIPMSDTSEHIKPEDVKPTVLPDHYIQSDVAIALRDFTLPRYQQLPNVSLYRDQLIEYVGHCLEPLSICVELPLLTPSMVNNYVKIGLIPAPLKKQYGREQVAKLIVICIFKQILPISAIQALFRIQKFSYDGATAYNYVAEQLEETLRATFSIEQRPVRESASMVTRESLLVRSAVSSFVSKAYLMGYLKFNGFDGNP